MEQFLQQKIHGKSQKKYLIKALEGIFGRVPDIVFEGFLQQSLEEISKESSEELPNICGTFFGAALGRIPKKNLWWSS